MGGGEQVGNTYHVYGDMNVLNKAGEALSISRA